MCRPDLARLESDSLEGEGASPRLDQGLTTRPHSTIHRSGSALRFGGAVRAAISRERPSGIRTGVIGYRPLPITLTRIGAARSAGRRSRRNRPRSPSKVRLRLERSVRSPSEWAARPLGLESGFPRQEGSQRLFPEIGSRSRDVRQEVRLVGARPTSSLGSDQGTTGQWLSWAISRLSASESGQVSRASSRPLTINERAGPARRIRPSQPA